MVTEHIRKCWAAENARRNPVDSSHVIIALSLSLSSSQMLHMQGTAVHKPNGVAIHQCRAYEFARNAFPLPAER